jgi:acyl-CoA thioesterase II
MARTQHDFAQASSVTGGGGEYRAQLSADWQVWGPFGGYVAAVALRALAAESALRRPASFHCDFLAVARFAEIRMHVTTLRRGKRSHALAARVEQDGAPILAASAWFIDAGMDGFAHEDGVMPAVPPPAALRSFAELAENYAEWYPIWRCVDGKPSRWSDEPGAPVWHTWMRFVDTPSLDDPILDAARSVMWMDMMMWNAAIQPHLPGPLSHLAPSLDLSVLFHAPAPDDEWLLCDAHAPVARAGLVGCTGRLWAPSGRQVASGSSHLLCRPNPFGRAP